MQTEYLTRATTGGTQRADRKRPRVGDTNNTKEWWDTIHTLNTEYVPPFYYP